MSTKTMSFIASFSIEKGWETNMQGDIREGERLGRGRKLQRQHIEGSTR